jgi:uncharacterized protein (DUF1697 family)
MPRYIAFLRAINVGRHIVKMTELRRLFEELSFRNVETFIASGQVIFETRTSERARLESRIEKHLRAQLGYDVATFVRTPIELEKIAQRPRHDGATLYVGFTRAPPDRAAVQKLMAHSNETDELAVQGSEVYWYARKKFSESKFTGAMLEKAIGMPATLRNINTIDRLVAKYAE